MVELVLLLMLLASVRTGACPTMCTCKNYPKDATTTSYYTSVVCNGYPENITTYMENTTRELHVRHLEEHELSELMESLLNQIDQLPNLSSLKISESTVEHFNDSLDGFENVHSLSLTNNELKTFPDLFLNFSSLLTLDLSNNLITVLNINSFRTLRTLEVLNLSANSLTTISSDSFSGLISLKCLDLSENNLTGLDDKVLLPLSALQYLNLSSNRLEVINEACFSSLVRLQQLDVSWNRLARVAPGSLQLPSLARLLLAGNPKLGGSREPAVLVGTGRRLQTVDASRTGLKQVPAALTHSIRTLRLAGNSIRSVSCGDLDSYPLLQLLDFTSNELEVIEDDALGRLDSLSILYLSDNNIHDIPKSLPEQLKVLHLQHNGIEKLSKAGLQGLTALEVLVLSDNKIRVVEEAAFSQLESLVTLDLSRNPINVLHPDCLSGPAALQVLRLSSIGIIPPAKEVSFPLSTTEHLIMLDLSGSPGLARQLLADTAALAASRELQELDLTRTDLQFIRSDLLHYLPQLRILHIKENKLNCSQLNWLGAWMRRQDLTEYKEIVCATPSEYWGTLLVDLQELPPGPQLSTQATKFEQYYHTTQKPGDELTNSPIIQLNQTNEIFSIDKENQTNSKIKTATFSTTKYVDIKNNSNAIDGSGKKVKKYLNHPKKNCTLETDKNNIKTDKNVTAVDEKFKNSNFIIKNIVHNNSVYNVGKSSKLSFEKLLGNVHKTKTVNATEFPITNVTSGVTEKKTSFPTRHNKNDTYIEHKQQNSENSTVIPYTETISSVTDDKASSSGEVNPGIIRDVPVINKPTKKNTTEEAGKVAITTKMKAPPPQLAANSYLQTVSVKNANETDDSPHYKVDHNDVMPEISHNLFIASKVETFNNAIHVATDKHDGNLKNSFTGDKDILNSSTTGEMSMYTHPDQGGLSFYHPGMLILAIGVLGTAATLAMLTAKFTKRRRNTRLFQQEDIEVSSLPGVTELW